MHHIRLAALTAALLITHASNTSVSVRALPALAALPGGEDAVVVAITDGDTIDVTINGAPATVRYIGIDTPETKQPNAPVQCYGPEASAANEALVLGQTLRLEKDRSNTDRYGRLLRYAWLPDGRLVNAELVKQGAAFARRYRPDTRRNAELQRAMAEARLARRGLWAACVVTNLKTQPLAPLAPVAPIAPAPTAVAAAPATGSAGNCDPSYPTVCIPPAPPDLDCGDISFRRFQVLAPDPHRFDSNHDGVGCEGK